MSVRNYNDRYQKIVQSDEFKKVYDNKSIEDPTQPERTLRSFYDWYREANAATREDILNELKRRLEIE